MDTLVGFINTTDLGELDNIYKIKDALTILLSKIIKNCEIKDNTLRYLLQYKNNRITRCSRIDIEKNVEIDYTLKILKDTYTFVKDGIKINKTYFKNELLDQIHLINP